MVFESFGLPYEIEGHYLPRDMKFEWDDLISIFETPNLSADGEESIRLAS